MNKGEKKTDLFSWSIATLLISLAGIMPAVLGASSSTQSTTGFANITKNVAIGLSSDLASGIGFINLDINTADNNATAGTTGANGNFNASSNTTFWVLLTIQQIHM